MVSGELNDVVITYNKIKSRVKMGGELLQQALSKKQLLDLQGSGHMMKVDRYGKKILDWAVFGYTAC